MAINRHGLSRRIPEAAALEIRRRSKFGCVICRCAIYQYEHIEPEFADARSHDPNHICLLCGGCHDRVTRGRISKETVRAKYREVEESAGIRRPFEPFDLSAPSITVAFGGCTFELASVLMRINGEDLLSITPPKDGACFPTLSGIFYDHQGKESFRITDNVWEGQNNSWDIECVADRLTIKGESGAVVLQIVLNPPSGLTITHLDLYKDNCHVECVDGTLLVGQSGDYGAVALALDAFSCVGAKTGIDVDSRSDSPPVFKGVTSIGGKGHFVDGTGIQIAVGAGIMRLGRVRVFNLTPEELTAAAIAK